MTYSSSFFSNLIYNPIQSYYSLSLIILILKNNDYINTKPSTNKIPPSSSISLLSFIIFIINQAKDMLIALNYSLLILRLCLLLYYHLYSKCIYLNKNISNLLDYKLFLRCPLFQYCYH